MLTAASTVQDLVRLGSLARVAQRLRLIESHSLILKASLIECLNEPREPAICTRTSRRTLVFGWPLSGPDHEAIIRFSGEAPGRRAHSTERSDDHVGVRVTTTSDRERPTRQWMPAERAETLCSLLVVLHRN
jgi:hypothetical protein